MSVTQLYRAAAFHCPLGDTAFALRRMSGEDILSKPFAYDVELLSEDPGIDLNSLLGQPASIRMALGRGGNRYFHGVVSRIQLLPASGPYTEYRCVLVPHFWILTRTSDCRIFQDKNVPEIVSKILSDAGIEFQLRLTEDYPAREYCVQYRETHFDFVSRLLEEEGITYYFEHSAKGHIMVLSDSIAGHPDTEGFETVRFSPEQEVDKDPQAIRNWVAEAEIQPGAFAHTDYNFVEPSRYLLAKREVSPAHRLGSSEIFDFPGEYTDPEVGDRYARIRLEELRARHATVRGEADVRGLVTGHCFTLARHPRADQNLRYLIRSVWHRLELTPLEGDPAAAGTTPLYQCSFTGMPAAHPFRPARETPRPVVKGPQTAFVVGPPKQKPADELHIDEHARVKVQFHWDRQRRFAADSSCWIRVCQPWAGKDYGGLCVPRIGQEVLVEFLEGDPDRPIINGRVYNGETMPPASNAGRDGKKGNQPPKSVKQAAMMTSIKSQTLGGGGSNEITMNDSPGGEGLFMKAQKDEIHQVGNDREDTVGNNETRKVGVDRSREVGNDEKVKVGNNRTHEVGNNESITVGNNQSASIGKNKSETVAIASVENVGVVKTLSVGVGYQVSVGASMNTTVALTQTEQVGLVKHTLVGSKYTLEVGSASITLEAGGKVTIKGTEFEFVSSGPVKINGSVVDIN